jgi:hypothetical protein
MYIYIYIYIYNMYHNLVHPTQGSRGMSPPSHALTFLEGPPGSGRSSLAAKTASELASKRDFIVCCAMRAPVCGNNSSSGVGYAVRDLGAQLCGPEFLTRVHDQAFLAQLERNNSPSSASGPSSSPRHGKLSRDGASLLTENLQRNSGQDAYSGLPCAVMILDGLDRVQQIGVANALIGMFEMFDNKAESSGGLERQSNGGLEVENMEGNQGEDDMNNKSEKDGQSRVDGKRVSFSDGRESSFSDGKGVNFQGRSSPLFHVFYV